MTKRAWQSTVAKAGRYAGVTGVAMFFAGAAAIVVNQASTGETKGRNEYEIGWGYAATAPNEFQAQAMMFSLAGMPVTLLGILSLGAGYVPLPEKKKDKGGPSL